MNARVRLTGPNEPIIARVFDAPGNPISGATVNIRIKRTNDGFFFDWSDDTFKVFGSVVTPDQALVEETNVAGTYRLNIAVRHVEGFDFTTASNANDDVLVVNFDVTSPANVTQPLPITIQIGEWVEDIFGGQVALEANIRGGDSRDLTELAGVGWVAADNLVQAHNKLDGIQADIDNFENITKVKVSLPTFERPSAGSTTYEFFFNLKDDAGDPVDADGGAGGTVTLEATAHGGIAGDRDVNLGSTTMTNIGTGRYRGTYVVASTHALEGIHLSFVWSEGGNADVLDKSFTVLDSDVVGYLASDRVRDDQIAVETSSLDGTKITTARANNLDEITAARLAELDPANLPADVDTLLARLTALRATNLDNLDAAISLVLSTGAAGPWTTAAAGTGLTATQAAQLLYMFTFVGGDPANLMTMIRAVAGVPGRTRSADLLVDQEVVRVSNTVSTYEQQ